jgi:hypothetical protein
MLFSQALNCISTCPSCLSKLFYYYYYLVAWCLGVDVVTAGFDTWRARSGWCDLLANFSPLVWVLVFVRVTVPCIPYLEGIFADLAPRHNPYEHDHMRGVVWVIRPTCQLLPTYSGASIRASDCTPIWTTLRVCSCGLEHHLGPFLCCSMVLTRFLRPSSTAILCAVSTVSIVITMLSLVLIVCVQLVVYL